MTKTLIFTYRRVTGALDLDCYVGACVAFDYLNQFGHTQLYATAQSLCEIYTLADPGDKIWIFGVPTTLNELIAIEKTGRSIVYFPRATDECLKLLRRDPSAAKDFVHYKQDFNEQPRPPEYSIADNAEIAWSKSHCVALTAWRYFADSKTAMDKPPTFINLIDRYVRAEESHFIACGIFSYLEGENGYYQLLRMEGGEEEIRQHLTAKGKDFFKPKLAHIRQVALRARVGKVLDYEKVPYIIFSADGSEDHMAEQVLAAIALNSANRDYPFCVAVLANGTFVYRGIAIDVNSIGFKRKDPLRLISVVSGDQNWPFPTFWYAWNQFNTMGYKGRMNWGVFFEWLGDIIIGALASRANAKCLENQQQEQDEPDENDYLP